MLQRPLSRDPLSRDPFSRFAYGSLSLFLIATATFFAFRIAATTGFNTHPDEITHADGFCFFESHWLPPPLSAPGLRYDPFGNSRVYEQEVVYLIFGKVASILHPMVEPLFEDTAASQTAGMSRLFLPLIYAPNYCSTAYHTYRLLNVVLLPLTLAMLFWFGLRFRWAASMGLILVAIPQAIYLYSYANSDAWGLSLSAVLMVTSLVYHERARLGLASALWWGLLTGLVLLSKSPFWLTILVATLILAHKVLKMWQTERTDAYRFLRSWLPVALLVAFVVSSPLKIIYPISQGDYQAGVVAMHEQWARADLRPSHPTAPGYLLRARGVPFSEVWADPEWWRLSFASLYGVFGYWSMFAKTWVYYAAASLLLLGIACTYVDFIRRRAAYSSLVRLMLLVAPLAFIAIVVASLLYSWVYAVQPQGRFLLPALLPAALLVGGAVDDEARPLGLLRSLIWLCLLALSFYTLWQLVSAA